MKAHNKIITAHDGIQLHTYQWMPDDSNNLKAILFLIHGSVEHAKRYEHFARFLTDNNCGVYAFDMRGHGKTTDVNSSEFAHMKYKKGWELMLQDVKTVHNQLKKDYGELPHFIFGHSMGSFVVRDYIANYDSNFNGAILCGSTLGEKMLVKVLMTVTNIMAFFKNPKAKSKFLHNQVYGKLTKSVKNYQTPVDFISRDTQEVQKYIKDELSGKRISIGYAHEMGKGILKVAEKQTFLNTPETLPILIVSGEDDPVGGKKADGVIALQKAYENRGIKNLTMKIYKDARHELLNEVNKEEVMSDILNWIMAYK